MQKVIWWNVKFWEWVYFEVYFLWEYRGLANMYLEKLYRWRIKSNSTIIKTWSDKEIEDAIYNTDRMRKHFNY